MGDLKGSFYILILLFICTSCATKYVIPGNRFISPESVGGVLKVQAEIQQNSSKVAAIDVSDGNTNNKLQYNDKIRTGYFFGASLFEQLDFLWYQTASSVSFVGARIQVIGGSKASNSAGHKLSITAALGGNDHEIDSSDPKIDFTMKGQDYSLIHGYRFSENFMIYESLSQTNITFDGKLKSNNPLFNALEVNYKTTLYGLFVGGEFSFNSFMAKLECGYQIIKSTHTPDKEGVMFGYALGYNF
jgi:hypothetical protein